MIAIAKRRRAHWFCCRTKKPIHNVAQCLSGKVCEHLFYIERGYSYGNRHSKEQPATQR